MDKKAFGKRLQKYREEAGYSQEKLGEIISRSSIFISYMERGVKSPSIDTLILIANALKISVDLLLGDEVQNNHLPRLRYLEEKMESLSSMEQQKMMDILESLIKIELMYRKEDDDGDEL